MPKATTTHNTPVGSLEAPLLALREATDTIGLLKFAVANRPEISEELAAIHKKLGEAYEDLSIGVFEAMADAPTQAEVAVLRAENIDIRRELEILYEAAKTLAAEAAWRTLCAAARAALAAAESAGMLDVS